MGRGIWYICFWSNEYWLKVYIEKSFIRKASGHLGIAQVCHLLQDVTKLQNKDIINKVETT